MHSRRRKKSRSKSILRKIALVGNPNVGKSVIFNRLTGTYVTVSNYPGTTVEVTRGRLKLEDEEFEVIDTPGMYSLIPLTEDERVARSILIDEKPELAIHIIDTKNLNRMLPFTLQLLELDIPLVLNLNIIDEAERLDMQVDIKQLSRKLGIPVVATVATTGRGIKDLKETIKKSLKEVEKGKFLKMVYPKHIEISINEISSALKKKYRIPKRAVALFLLQKDFETHSLVEKYEGKNYVNIKKLLKKAIRRDPRPLRLVISLNNEMESNSIIDDVLSLPLEEKTSFSEKLSQLMMKPITGIPILLLVLYVGLYQFVGILGAGKLVGYLESVLFEEYLNPYVTSLVINLIPFEIFRDLLVGEYGIFTLGVRYAVAIILPIVGTFFLAFSILEDSGYLPRMAALVDSVLKKIGLTGRAIIPITLGLGCDTMATIVTRTLETKKERIISTFLLALAIPCSAQLGVIFAILARNPASVLVWALIILLVFLFIGYLTTKILPGEKPNFYMEIPSLRIPKLSNVVMKTYTRIEWYFLEVFPIFILASILIWLGRIIGVFDIATSLLGYPVIAIGLPKEVTVAFLFGFFRRDYGAAGLYDLQARGLLSGTQLLISAVTLTLFIPCIAQLAVSIKERGLKVSLAMMAFIFPFAFFVGFILNLIFSIFGVNF